MIAVGRRSAVGMGSEEGMRWDGIGLDEMRCVMRYDSSEFKFYPIDEFFSAFFCIYVRLSGERFFLLH